MFDGTFLLTQVRTLPLRVGWRREKGRGQSWKVGDWLLSQVCPLPAGKPERLWAPVPQPTPVRRMVVSTCGEHGRIRENLHANNSVQCLPTRSTNTQTVTVSSSG